MTTRLTRSTQGLIRAIQISRSTLHIFVEGREIDSYVYAKLAARELGAETDYRVIRGDQLTVGAAGNAGGKSVLIQSFELMRRNNALKGTFKGVQFACLYFVDKDVDDLRRVKRRSDSLCYTQTYDIEGEVWKNGDLVDALAASCSLDPRTLPSQFERSAWVAAACDLWREWTVLCLCARLLQSPIAGYSSPSQVNRPDMTGPVSAPAVATYKAALRHSSGLSQSEFNLTYERARRTALRLYASGNATAVFKGKWFKLILNEQFRQAMPAAHRRTPAFGSRVLSQLAQSLDADAPWARPYREAIRRNAS